MTDEQAALAAASQRPRVWRAGEGPVSVWSVPNLITYVRILFVPALVAALIIDGGEHGGWRWAAATIFIVGIASDAVDGHLARSRNLISDVGKLLDPIADKAITGTTMVMLSILGELPWWVTIVILVRELGITIWRLIEARRIVLPAGRGGKLKTIVQAVALSLALLPLPALVGDWMHWVNTLFMSAALILTVWSGADYLVRAYWKNERLRPSAEESR
ncbi:CDP-diacylglycerol--glycerol-3-phosphate 3-phosphatidyltransferase [uncultured Gulosibacter sp.]|uniref:CDP-diacylglycerol--glycerol-3-phosphate 3-phosphatidyltransferase n=1 Tax=uncultured Gulosibacter sp. TaxID=1339167 RepID=UPI00288BE5EA|nr:CDP-diacylglycerol--glycerol-3-phosphate 3-phosphatidyltransferase [uncultured Gulosibacter sp.]